ncbi:hypothetical protein GF312_07685 [Candidatus Poribacteria bacterium]|nr:hypothetical protein [Candidatus Poribacteria bacterium]
MNKGKGKDRNRRNAAVTAFGLGGLSGKHDNTPIYQSSFQEGDMDWLAKEYQRRSQRDPSLRLEDFAAHYGILADEIRLYIPDLSRDIDRNVILWHGTTLSCAKSILEEGFRVKKSRKERRIFFASKTKIPGNIAIMRSRNKNDKPAILKCCISLNKYSNFERRGNDVYVFNYERIDSDVVIRVDGLKREDIKKSFKKEKVNKSEITDIALTFSSSPAAISYWINTCLGLIDEDTVYESSPVVGKTKQWLDQQLGSGRTGIVPEDELLSCVMSML